MTAPAPLAVDSDLGDQTLHYACGKCYPLPWKIGEVKRTRCGLVRIFDAVMRNVPMCVVCSDTHKVYPCGEDCVSG